MSTYNICFCGETRKIFTRYRLLSRPMSSSSVVIFYLQEAFYIKHGIWFQYLSTVMATTMACAMFVQVMNQHWFIRMVSIVNVLKFHTPKFLTYWHMQTV